MHKFFHLLFGWDYIYWSNCTDQGVARIYKSPDGKIYYYRYKATGVLDIVEKPAQVLWLTCPASKFFPS